MENINYIVGTTIDDREVVFDGFAVESYISFKNLEGEDCVLIGLASGANIRVFSRVDQKVFPGENMETLLDRCIVEKYKLPIARR